MRNLLFDRIKVKANYKYLLEQQTRFNETYNHQNGDLIGLIYSSKDDSRVPFNLYIAVSYPKQTLTLEFSSKVLGCDYPKLMSKHNIRQCLENINHLGVCHIDVNGILKTGCITSADVTKDVHFTISDEALQALSLKVNNYRRYKWSHYVSEGIDFVRDVKSSKCKECIRIYRKDKEILSSKNKAFLNTLPNKEDVINHFQGMTRFEIRLESREKLKTFLNITDTYINDVLNSDANPILTMYDRVFGQSKEVPSANKGNYDDYTMQLILERHQGDMKSIEMELRPRFSSRSGLKKRMDKIQNVWEQMQSDFNGGTDYVSSVRSLLV